MSKIKIASLALVAAAPLCAQTSNYAYSPPGYASKEGQYYAYYLGNYPSSNRVQLADGEQRTKVMSIKEFALRATGNYNYSTYSGMGRTFKSVTIDMCDTDVAKMVNTFGMNQKSTPTRVFSASVSWPTLTGNQGAGPLPFGGRSGEYKFSFKTSWLTLGLKDILTDWSFSGGTLANNYNWTSTLSRSYYFDSWYALSPTSSAGGTYTSMPPTRLNNNSPGVTGRCNDSALTYTYGAYLYAYAYVYGKYYSSTHWRDKLRMYSYSYYTALDAPVIHAIGAIPHVKGIDLGTGCNKLHMSPAGILLMMTTKTLPRQYNASGYSGYFELLFPADPAAGGFQLAFQGAWADSKTGKLNVSQARLVTLPSVNPEPNFTCVRSYGTYNPYGPYSTYYYNPIRRYGF